MSNPTVQYVIEGNHVPRRASAGASGMDLTALRIDKIGGEKAIEPWFEMGNPLGLMPYERVRIGTGIYTAIPEGFEGQIRPRSGLADDYGLTVLNTPGTVDADYRGEIKVLLINLGHEQVVIEPGDRIAQLVIAPVASLAWDVVDVLPGTERGDGGFGSTGT